MAFIWEGRGKTALARLVSLLQESCWGRGSALIRDRAVVPVHFELELELDCSTFSLLKNENDSSSTPHPSLQPSVKKKKKKKLFIYLAVRVLVSMDGIFSLHCSMLHA